MTTFVGTWRRYLDIQYTVEVASRVCCSIPEFETHLRGIVASVHENYRRLGMTLCGAGTHPFGQRLARFSDETRKPNSFEVKPASTSSFWSEGTVAKGQC